MIKTMLILALVCISLNTNKNDSYQLEREYSPNVSLTKRSNIFPPKVYEGVQNNYFIFDNFYISDFWVKDYYDFYFTFTCKRPGYNYFVELNYYNDIDDGGVLIDSYYLDLIGSPVKGKIDKRLYLDDISYKYGVFVLSVEVYPSEINNYNKSFEQSIDFRMFKKYQTFQGGTGFFKIPYDFKYTNTKHIGLARYSCIRLNDYPTNTLDQLHFRIKPNMFKFRTIFSDLYSDAWLFIDNCSFFDEVGLKDSHGRTYFEFITVFDETTGNYYLEYKSTINGGKKDLYLNPFDLTMSNSKENDYTYRVKNLYIPKNVNLRNQSIKGMLKILSFGHCPTSIEWDLEIFFNNYGVDNFYFTSQDNGCVNSNDSQKKVIIPWM